MKLLKKIIKNRDVCKKLFGTFVILMILLIGYRIPLPGVDIKYLQYLSSRLDASGAGGFMNALTGGSFAQMSLFALSVSPYITASMVLQLLAVLIPPLAELQKGDSVGKKKLERLTYIVAAIVGFIQALSTAISLGQNGLFVTYAWWIVVYAAIMWTLGSCFLIWIGNIISRKFIGSGVTMILMFNMLISLPNDMKSVFHKLNNDAEWYTAIFVIVGIIVTVALMFAYTIVLEGAVKLVPISNATVVGHKMESANEEYLPMKLNMGGVTPVIFSSSVMSLPVMMGMMSEVDPSTLWGKIIACLDQSNWFNAQDPMSSIGIVIFALLTFLFALLYNRISFNPDGIAESLRQSGTMILNVKPGSETAHYLDGEAKSMIWLGTSMLTIIALIPTLISGVLGLTGLSFGGTSIIIIVNTALELRNMLEVKTADAEYKSLVKEKNNG